jgi:hypothetical protein
MDAGCRVCSLDREKRKKIKSKKTHFFFLVSILGVVGTDLVGQVIGRVYGGWLSDNGGGGHGHCHQGWWVRAWVRERRVVVVSRGGGSWGEDMWGSAVSRDRKKLK